MVDVAAVREQIRRMSEGVHYEDEPHTYERLSDGVMLDSSSKIAKFGQPEFDEDYWLPYKGLERVFGRKPNEAEVNAYRDSTQEVIGGKDWNELDWSVHQLGLEWEAASDLGKDRGTQVHLFGEYLWQGQARKLVRHAEATEHYALAYTSVVAFYRDWHRKLKCVACECRCYSRVWPVAGTFDMLASDDLGRMYIVDYKSDKQVSESRYDECSAPISHLPAGELTKYSLQLRLYALMLAEWGIKIHGYCIVHLRAHRTGVSGEYALISKLNATDADLLSTLRHLYPDESN